MDNEPNLIKETTDENGYLVFNCTKCDETVRALPEYEGLPPPDPRWVAEMVLAMGGCEHISKDVLNEFKYERDTGMFLARYPGVALPAHLLPKAEVAACLYQGPLSKEDALKALHTLCGVTA